MLRALLSLGAVPARPIRVAFVLACVRGVVLFGKPSVCQGAGWWLVGGWLAALWATHRPHTGGAQVARLLRAVRVWCVSQRPAIAEIPTH